MGKDAPVTTEGRQRATSAALKASLKMLALLVVLALASEWGSIALFGAPCEGGVPACYVSTGVKGAILAAAGAALFLIVMLGVGLLASRIAGEAAERSKSEK
jgi:hypothetical protein